MPSVYGERSISVRFKDFKKWALQIQFNSASNKYVLFYSAPFWEMLNFNNARYTEKEVGQPTENEQVANPETYLRNNVQFMNTFKRDTMKESHTQPP